MEAHGQTTSASEIYSAFINGGKPFKDVNTRYMRLIAGAGHAAAAAPADPGATVAGAIEGGKYKILREVGRGGMGVVYEALNTRINKRVALKKMREELSISGKDRRRFLEEARRVSELHHSGIVDIYDIYEDKGLYLVFEYLDGETLSALLERTGRLPAAKTAAIGVEVCGALAFAHSRKVIHRDIKSANIMLTAEGAVKVMDFGIAREAQDSLSRLTGIETSGTFAYMAPEQHLGFYDERSDLYSLGITLYESVTGELPFRGPDFLAQKRELILRRPRELCPDIPGVLEEIILRCLEPEKEKRPQSAGELAAALKEAGKTL